MITFTLFHAERPAFGVSGSPLRTSGYAGPGLRPQGPTEDKVRKVLKIANEPSSMETPIGDDEDSHLGDFIEDTAAESPLDSATVEPLRETVHGVLSQLTPREAFLFLGD
jgi:hypothetical protein